MILIWEYTPAQALVFGVRGIRTLTMADELAADWAQGRSSMICEEEQMLATDRGLGGR